MANISLDVLTLLKISQNIVSSPHLTTLSSCPLSYFKDKYMIWYLDIKVAVVCYILSLWFFSVGRSAEIRDGCAREHCGCNEMEAHAVAPSPAPSRPAPSRYAPPRYAPPHYPWFVWRELKWCNAHMTSLLRFHHQRAWQAFNVLCARCWVFTVRFIPSWILSKYCAWGSFPFYLTGHWLYLELSNDWSSQIVYDNALYGQWDDNSSHHDTGVEQSRLE